jgi:2-polyprenyl-3-methyl-5-hydroxy-6-metoxy-1,4-benzoquinol methylase
VNDIVSDGSGAVSSGHDDGEEAAAGTAGTKQGRIARYESIYGSSYGFEGVMVAARRRLILELLHSAPHDVIVEVGCGSDLLVERAAADGLSWNRWVIVEPAPGFVTLARDAARRHEGVVVVKGFIEDAVAQVCSATGRGADVVLCSSVLHEVDDERAVLRAMSQLLSRNGRLHVNVPNASSLHRRLARAMGLIADEHELTARNRALEQRRLYDLSSLVDLLQSVGLEVETTGGYFLKSFTHEQMETLDFLSDEMLAGLDRLGRQLPELAAEIYVNARLVL